MHQNKKFGSGPPPQLPVKYSQLPAFMIGQIETLIWRIHTQCDENDDSSSDGQQDGIGLRREVVLDGVTRLHERLETRRGVG